MKFKIYLKKIIGLEGGKNLKYSIAFSQVQTLNYIVTLFWSKSAYFRRFGENETCIRY